MPRKITRVDPAMGLLRRWVAGFAGDALPQPAVGLECLRQGWGTLQLGRGFQAEHLKLGERAYRQGLGAHADSAIALRSAKPMERLHAVVGVDANSVTLSAAGEKVRVVFSVHVGDQEVWRGAEMNVKTAAAAVDVPLPAGTREVVLQATAVDGNLACAHADWAGLEVVTEGQAVPIGATELDAVAPPLHGPFSFLYGGKSSSAFLGAWERRTAPAKPGKGFRASTVTWRDPASGLECRLATKVFEQYPAVEWTVYFNNIGARDSEMIEDIQAADLAWPVGGTGEGGASGPPRVWRSRGSQCGIRDFEYTETEITPGSRLAMAAGGGRSSNQWLPFFNLQTAGLGVLTAIGWTGQWACSFQHTAGGLRFHAGIEKTHLRLHPGEEIRGPRMLQLFWTGDRLEAHNQWRRLLMDHYVPRVKGQPVTGPFTMAHWGGMKTADHLQRIALYRKERMPHEYYWVDAGWYGLNSTFSPDEFVGDWAQHTGDWRVNPKAHPHGLRPIAQAAAQAGMKFLLWVEPERAIAGTHWTLEHPEWFLKASGGGQNLLLNLGLPAAREGATNMISGLIQENRIALYRQDFNLDPLAYWRENDAPDRVGITEIRHVAGLYAFWDELLRRHPGLIIDNCSSGGRRIDLEMISRSIPLWRSDWQCRPDNDPIGGQTHGMGLSYWVPLHGTGSYNSMPRRALYSTYRTRSGMGPAWQFSTFPYESTPIDPHYPWDWFRRMAQDYLRARAAFTGDYYPLTPASPAADIWAAYQMHQPKTDEGFLMAFRRTNAPWLAASFQLRGLDPAGRYEIFDADSRKRRRATGHQLLTRGVEVRLPQPDSSALLFYRRI